MRSPSEGCARPRTTQEGSPAGHEERLTIILAEAAKIESLVSQWMFLARPQPPQLSPCDLAELITASIRTHAPAAAEAV